MLEAPVKDYEVKATELTRPFWDAVREGRLVVQRCSACEKTFFRPEVACPHCFSAEWRWVESSGRGTLYSVSVVHRAPSPAFKAPFVFAAVDMEEGWTMFSNVIGIEPEDAKIGMKLKVSFEHPSDTLSLPLFRPADV
jgi:uncharacterized OB-fold protein